jgi:hypothetical protein
MFALAPHIALYFILRIDTMLAPTFPTFSFSPSFSIAMLFLALAAPFTFFSTLLLTLSPPSLLTTRLHVSARPVPPHVGSLLTPRLHVFVCHLPVNTCAHCFSLIFPLFFSFVSPHFSILVSSHTLPALLNISYLRPLLLLYLCSFIFPYLLVLPTWSLLPVIRA